MQISQHKALFIQATEPGAYPPLINAAHIMAVAGWKVTFLAAPIAGKHLTVTPAPGIKVINVAVRPSHVLSKQAYFDYCCRAIALARQLRPNVVYASDPTGALPGWLAAKYSGARLIYHEHDSPSAESALNPIIRRARRHAAKAAEIVILPNAERGGIAQETIGFDASKLQTVWNVPRIAELPDIPVKPETPLLLWYHGSINPERLPETILEAIFQFKGEVRLDVAGYEAPGAKGYINHLIKRWNTDSSILINYVGVIEHTDLLELAAKRHVGLAFMPMQSNDINMVHMVGASNKPFDYMAAGLALIVSDLPEWRKLYVEKGFGLACNPNSAESIITAIALFLENPKLLISYSKSCRAKIANYWNYEKEFSKIKF